MCPRKPSRSHAASPELTESAGIPAATAALMDGASASGSGTEIASALGRLATAASMSWLIRTMSKLLGAWYSSLTPSSRAASPAPLATMDQKGSDV